MSESSSPERAGVSESSGNLSLLGGIDAKSRRVVSGDAAAGPHGQLSTRLRRTPDEGRDLGELEAEHIVEDEARPLRGRELFKNHHQRHPYRFVKSHAILRSRAGQGRIDDRFGQPGPDVRGVGWSQPIACDRGTAGW